MVLAFTLYLLKDKEFKVRHLAFFVPSIAAIMASGARVFLLSLLVILGLYYVLYIKSISWKIIIVPIAIAAGIYVFLRSGMATKFNFVRGNQYISNTALGQMSSGRIDFWKIDLIAYSQYGFLEKLVGNGFDRVYQINRDNYGLSIWSHNDVINLLLSVGALGTLFYLLEVRRVLITISRSVEKIFVRWLMFAYIVIPLLLNGFFGYQHYVYSVVILMIVVSIKSPP